MPVIPLLLLLASAAQATETERPLWHPYRITPRAGAQHILLDGRWELAYRDTPVASKVRITARAWNAAAREIRLPDQD